MPNRTIIALLGLSLLACTSLPAIAQDKETGGLDRKDSGEIMPECRAQPEAGQKEKEQGETREGLAKRLERCKGVLKPPPTGDTESDIPPPDTGKTPVIPPGIVPDQPQDN
ncbi:hypothetical protein [Phyllobacterium phragmitis]|uniref:3',5'-cyclic-nucleotide phosphodiesterase n=1 Tax=Phyllobacterium phragmitis TaxID=2670329 RepID=A0ABQ0GUL2_9HYPH